MDQLPGSWLVTAVLHQSSCSSTQGCDWLNACPYFVPLDEKSDVCVIFPLFPLFWAFWLSLLSLLKWKLFPYNFWKNAWFPLSVDFNDSFLGFLVNVWSMYVVLFGTFVEWFAAVEIIFLEKLVCLISKCGGSHPCATNRLVVQPACAGLLALACFPLFSSFPPPPPSSYQFICEIRWTTQPIPANCHAFLVGIMGYVGLHCVVWFRDSSCNFQLVYFSACFLSMLWCMLQYSCSSLM